MNERKNAVTSNGKPLTLLGDWPKVGAPAPDFTVLRNDMTPARLSDFAGKPLLIASVPSLDTPVCDTETRRFNREATSLGPDLVVLTISMDLPFAQGRWCGAAGVKNVVTASDHRDASFGAAYGVLVRETRLLARAVFVVDRKGILTYSQLVSDTSREPDYDRALAAAREVT